MKNLFVENINEQVKFEGSIEESFMIMKKVYREGNNTIAYIGDKTGDIKASIPDIEDILKVGDVIKVKGIKKNLLEISEFNILNYFDKNDYLPSVKRPIQEIMDEMNKISEEEFKSEESRALNNYFFKNNEFVEKFISGIGGLHQHHNYRGGLAEHTLNVMYMTKAMAYRYDSRRKDIAILGAKLHDIGKIEEYYTDGPFTTTTRGDIEGHIVIGVEMVEEAFKAGGDIYSEEFKLRIKGCIVQHHGKLEYGSPKVPNSEDAYMVHFADYMDATFNKIEQIKEITETGAWSEYDRRIGTRIFG